ncbi:MAG TPA: serine/threonine-protein kinase [Anaerolineales bacterium]|nr:serine/threonine-protein kinase [Anaerolineales bacterium]
MDNLQPGQMLGPYRIINQIGKGGMATVYKAYQASVDRYVAIKILPSQLAESPEFAARFHQEARIIAKLEHPHILPVFDYGESDGVAYFVMRYLDAGTLKDKMEFGRPLPLDEIDRIFTQLTDALSYAHAHGVVHRDLKPANALIDSSGNVFLTDFGIAKLLESASPRLTQTDAIMGTPAYISPEQAQARPVDQRSDIYSLGIILYEMVTGGVPFTADTPLAVLFKHISDPLPLPSLVKPDIPPSVEKVILKALSKNPQDRFATAAEFLAAWKRALEEKGTVRAIPTNQTQIQPTSAPRAASKAGKPTVWIVGCLAGLCLLFSVAGVAAVAFNWENLSFLNPATATPIPPTDVPPPTEAVNYTGSALLKDDFSSSQWGTGTDKDSSIEYVSNALQMIVYTKNWFVWSTPNDRSYQNIHLEVTVINHGTDPTTAFGIICNKKSSEATFYYFAITPARQYAIAKATAGQNDVFLTNNDQWTTSDAITKNASSYRLGADCGNGKLALYVDGQRIASVSDTTYTSGEVALLTWSGQNATNTNVSFDDFLMTSLK